MSFATVSWVDVFTRPLYNEIFIDSLRYCQEKKGLNLHAWCLMSNHVHLVFSRSGRYSHSDILRDLKKFTSKKLMEAIESNPSESKKEWMMNIFRCAGQNQGNNKDYQFWQQDNHPIELFSPLHGDNRLSTMPPINDTQALSKLIGQHWIVPAKPEGSCFFQVATFS